MSTRYAFLAAISAAALFAVSSSTVLADSQAAGSSNSGGNVTAVGDPQPGSSTVNLNAGGSQTAFGADGGKSTAGSFTSGGGKAGEFSFGGLVGLQPIGNAIVLTRVIPGGSGISGSFAKAGLITGGFATANSPSKSKPSSSSSETSSAQNNSSANRLCVVAVTDLTKWQDLRMSVRNEIRSCKCPTDEPGVAVRNPVCPEQHDFYTAEIK